MPLIKRKIESTAAATSDGPILTNNSAVIFRAKIFFFLKVLFFIALFLLIVGGLFIIPLLRTRINIALAPAIEGPLGPAPDCEGFNKAVLPGPNQHSVVIIGEYHHQPEQTYACLLKNVRQGDHITFEVLNIKTLISCDTASALYAPLNGQVSCSGYDLPPSPEQRALTITSAKIQNFKQFSALLKNAKKVPSADQTKTFMYGVDYWLTEIQKNKPTSETDLINAYHDILTWMQKFTDTLRPLKSLQEIQKICSKEQTALVTQQMQLQQTFVSHDDKRNKAFGEEIQERRKSTPHNQHVIAITGVAHTDPRYNQHFSQLESEGMTIYRPDHKPHP